LCRNSNKNKCYNRTEISNKGKNINKNSIDKIEINKKKKTNNKRSREKKEAKQAKVEVRITICGKIDTYN